MAASTLPKTVTKKELFEEAQVRFQSWVDMYIDSSVSAQNMYENMSCSCYSGNPADDFPDDVKDEQEPVLKENFAFDYKGYKFELSSCTTLTNIEQVLGITKENFIQKFPNGVFTDRYVCWMWGRTDCVAYLIPGAWLWGASIDLKVGSRVDKQILANIDKFLETFKEVHDD